MGDTEWVLSVLDDPTRRTDSARRSTRADMISVVRPPADKKAMKAFQANARRRPTHDRGLLGG